MSEKEIPPEQPQGLEMYFSPEVTEKFAELEQNDKNFRVAEIVDRVLIQETADLPAPLHVAELGGGAHPDRYHKFFDKLLTEPKGHIDWVDVSPYMLDLAKKYLQDEKYQNREEILSFIREDILKYLEDLPHEKLDLAIMKYTLDHIENIDRLFQLVGDKLKSGGKIIATVGILDPKLKSHSTNARYLYNGEEFPDDEIRILKDGDNFTVKFFNVSGDPDSGYLEGAETVKYFHSAEKIKELAESLGFDIFLGDWKEFIQKEEQAGEKLNQDILVLTKK